ncbi:hypothetical protein EP7_001353 [Isosphaeraceae bacterium EP7]
MSRPVLRIFGTLFSAAGLAATSGVALGQDHTADPYKPYNNQYQSFVYPSIPSNLALPGQARIYSDYLNGAFSERARESELFRDEENIFDRGTGGTSGTPGSYVGVPYYRAFRQHDKAYGRSVSPNQGGDRQFQRDREQLAQRRQDASQEKDPRKRAELLKVIERDELKSFRSGNEGRSGTFSNQADLGEARDRDAPGLRVERNTDPARRTSRTAPSAARPKTRRPPVAPPLIAAPTPEASRRPATQDRTKAARRTQAGTAAVKPPATAEPTPEQILERSERMSRETSPAIPPPPPIP